MTIINPFVAFSWKSALSIGSFLDLNVFHLQGWGIRLLSQYRFKKNNDIKMFVTELCQKELLVLLMAAPILMLEVSRNNMNLNIQRCF